MDRPLTGIRILAVEQYGAGPFGTQILADLGAELIKVENHKLGGDYARTLGPYFAEGAELDEGSLFFQSVNRNKKSLALDLARPEGREVLFRLVKNVDAVANNLRGDVPSKLGLTYESLAPHNPTIVCAHCSAYGREGPRRDWPGYDFLMQAETGFFHMSGEPDSPPTRMGLSVVDFMAGTYMALGLVSCVLNARSTGKGRDVDVNLFDSALSFYSYLATWTLNSDYEPGRIKRSAHPSIVPCQLYKTSDGWIYIMCNKEKFWQQFCKTVERTDLAKNPDYATFGSRLENRDKLTGIIDEILSHDTTDAWLEKFAKYVPAAPVRTPRDAIKLAEKEGEDKSERLEFPNGKGGYSVLNSPISAANCAGNKPCSPMGSDTMQILKDAGYSEDEISELQKMDLIQT